MRTLSLPAPALLAGATLACAVACADIAAGQSARSDPPAPVAPATVSRDATGRATVRAVRLQAPLSFDGRLDDEVYRAVPPIDGFIQQIPKSGPPPTERTDVWILFDDSNFYVSAHCYDSHPEREIVTEVRRDGPTMSQNDNFTFVLDTFYDQRTGYYFQTNPLGAVREQALANGVVNESWNTVWDVRSARTADGYTVEMMIPFKSLRYRDSGPQTWGFNVRRIVKWKNEVSSLTRLPVEYGPPGVTQLAVAATLVGVETPARSKNIEIKPYAVSSLTTDRAARQAFNNRLDADAGVDLKYGLTAGLTADVTVNTDFAQVEEDLQQVNLTRFNLQFPEKRNFFLEGQGIFAFGGQGGDVPTLFFSRQIGLSGGEPVPVLAGGRLTGKAGPYDVGLLNIQTDALASAGARPANFTTVRLRRDLFRRSTIGVLGTARHEDGRGTQGTFGVDAALAFHRNIESDLYWAGTSTPGVTDGDTSYRGHVGYTGDRYGLNADRVMVGARFHSAVGFVRRDDYRRNLVEGRFSPRLKSHPLIRKLTWQGGLDHVTTATGASLLDREESGSFGIEFHNSDSATIKYARQEEHLPLAFAVAPGVVVPRDTYHHRTLTGSYVLGQQRPVSGTLSISRGPFYAGQRTSASYAGRLGFSPRLVLEPAITLNWVRLPFGDFDARVISTRVIVTPTPRLGFGSLIQYNASTRTLSSSARMRWEYIPGSELFVVYSDGRSTSSQGFPNLVNRSVAVKATRLIRF